MKPDIKRYAFFFLLFIGAAFTHELLIIRRAPEVVELEPELSGKSKPKRAPASVDSEKGIEWSSFLATENPKTTAELPVTEEEVRSTEDHTPQISPALAGASSSETLSNLLTTGILEGRKGPLPPPVAFPPPLYSLASRYSGASLPMTQVGGVSGTSATSGPSTDSTPVISFHLDSYSLVHGKIYLNGRGLSNVTSLTLQTETGPAQLAITSSSSSQIVAEALRGVKVVAGKVYSLLLSDAHASATFPIDVEFPDLTAAEDGYIKKWNDSLKVWQAVPPPTTTFPLMAGNASSKTAPSFAFDTDTGIYSDVANAFGFSTGGSNRLYFNTSGNVTFNDSMYGYYTNMPADLGLNANGGSTGELDFVTDLANTYDRVGSSGNKGWRFMTWGNSFPTAALQQDFSMRYSNGAGWVDYIYFESSNGHVGIGTTAPGYLLQVGDPLDGSEARANAWNALSDERLKTNFRPIPDALEKILSLNGYLYQWKTSKVKGDKLGLKAQEVQKVFPEIVSTGSDGYLSVSYDHLLAPMIEAIREVHETNTQEAKEFQKLKEEVAALRAQNEALKEFICSQNPGQKICSK